MKAQKYCLQISKSHETYLGLDCEWNIHGKNGVDLIQIATKNIVYLFHNLSRLPNEMIKILENEKVKKVGVCVDRVGIAQNLGISKCCIINIKNIKVATIIFLRVLSQ